MDERNYGSLEACQRLDAAAIVRSTDVDCKTKEVGNAQTKESNKERETGLFCMWKHNQSNIL